MLLNNSSHDEVRAVVSPLHEAKSVHRASSSETMQNRGHARLSEDASAALPALRPLPVSSAREQKRRDLMLDDGVFAIRDAETRRYVTWRVWLYQLFSWLTLGTIAIVGYWPFCRRHKERALSVAAPAAEADFCLFTGADGSTEVCPVEPVAELPLELQPYWEAQRLKREHPARSIPLANRMVVHRHTRYVYRTSSGKFERLEQDEAPPAPCEAATAGLAEADAAARRRLFGHNLIDIPIPPIPVLLLRECVHPFVIFQVWAVCVWLSEGYISFSLFILATAISTAVTNLVDVRRNLLEIQRLSRYSTRVSVRRPASSPSTSNNSSSSAATTFQEVDSSELVPGDVVRVCNGMKLPADMVLLRGQATVTEAMLTGEATVVVKQPLTPAAVGALPGAGGAWDPALQADMRHSLFCGTQVVELRVPRGAPVLAVVVRTGFETVKGRLVLSILHPKAAHFKFMEESLRFIGILFACAMVGFVINARALADAGAGVDKIIQRGADMITIVVPPALPLAVTVGTIYALMALRKKGIFCISPPRVNLAGKINAFCFDKTGTLTTDSLELATLHPAHSAHAAHSAGFTLPTLSRDATPLPLLTALACCHSLTYVSGQLAGDPLEIKTFAFTQATLQEPHMGGSSSSGAAAADASREGSYHDVPHSTHNDSDHHEEQDGEEEQEPNLIHMPPSLTNNSSGSDGSADAAFVGAGGDAASYRVVQQFEFVAALQRMGVLVAPAASDSQRPGHGSGTSGISGSNSAPLLSFVKGSPEAIHSLCAPNTLPHDYWSVLASYTRKGYRVLAAGWRPVSAADLASASASAAADGGSAGALPALNLRTGTGGGGGDPVRALCERGLSFVGFIVLENRLKPESAPTIAALRTAGLHCAMATGDNAVSAVAVGRQCGLVEAGWRVYIGDLVQLSSASSTGSLLDLSGPGTATGGGSTGGGGGLAGGSPANTYTASATLALSPLPPAGPVQLNTASSVWYVQWTDADEGGGGGGALDPHTLLPTTPGADASKPYRLALTGRAFAALLEDVRTGRMPAAALQRIVLNATVFARMAPEHKASLVEVLQATGLYVGMIGDGANDSMALRAAHVGISLSQVEASVAAPFTSMKPSIDAILPVLTEGRGALTTSFCLFGFMALYSSIQFANALLIVFANSFLSNMMYLYQDAWIVFLLSLTLGNTRAATTLTRKRPSGRLFSAVNLTITFGFIFLTFVPQAIAFAAVRRQDWYGSAAYPASMTPEEDPEGTNSRTPETSSLFLLAQWQFIACAAIFSYGRPWKAGISSNYLFCAWMLIITVGAALLSLSPSIMGPVYDFLTLQAMPQDWHWQLFALSLFAFALYFLFMAGVAAARKRGLFSRCECRGGRRGKSAHKAIRAAWAAQWAGNTTITPATTAATSRSSSKSSTVSNASRRGAVAAALSAPSAPASQQPTAAAAAAATAIAHSQVHVTVHTTAANGAMGNTNDGYSGVGTNGLASPIPSSPPAYAPAFGAQDSWGSTGSLGSLAPLQPLVAAPASSGGGHGSRAVHRAADADAVADWQPRS